MFGGALGDLLPLAIGIAISPIPIIACILMLFSAKAKVNGPAFLVGWVAGLALVTTVVVYLTDTTNANDSTDGGASIGDVVTLLLGLGAIALAGRQWKGRPKEGETAAMPAWMQAIDAFAPGKALAFGVLLSALNPKNLGLSVAAGVVIDKAAGAGGSVATMVIAFVMVSSLSIAVPVIYMLVGGESARRTLQGWQKWLAANNGTVMAVLFLVIGAKLVGSGLGAFLG